MERTHKRYCKEDLMKLLIYSGKEKFVSSGADMKKQVIEGTDLTDTVEGAYESIEAFDFIETSNDKEPLALLLSRLRKGGRLSVQGIDSLKASELFVESAIDHDAFSNLVVQGNQRATSVNEIVQAVQKNGAYEIEFAGVNGIHYIVEVLKK